MYVVWGIRWDTEIDRGRSPVLALLAALSIGLLAFSAQAGAAQPAAPSSTPRWRARSPVWRAR